jgi:uncharacterized membrane protein SirB2
MLLTLRIRKKAKRNNTVEAIKQVLGGLIMTMTFVNGLLVQKVTSQIEQVTQGKPASDWWAMVLGPVGTLVLALSILLVLLRFFYTLQKKSDEQQRQIDELNKQAIADKDKQIEWLKANQKK